MLDILKTLARKTLTSKTQLANPATVVHPCVINGKPHIVYPRGLKESSPEIFSSLSRHFKKLGYLLKEDQRSAKDLQGNHSNRRKWAPVLIFTASVIFESSAYADSEASHHHSAHIQDPLSNHVQLQLMAKNNLQPDFSSPVVLQEMSEKTKINSETAAIIFQVLISRYERKNSDPSYVEDDFKQIANYYSEFPQITRLITDLKDSNWKLAYDKDNWVTTGSGNFMQVKKVVVHFNTRSAAQLRLNNGCDDNPVCIASPADALLHELLHVHSMLVKSEEFLQQGGMNNVVYPYQHEYRIIDAERNLYAAMSQHDNIKRPQRSEHTGRNIKATCPTCIK